MRRSSKLDNGGAIKFVSKRGQGHGEGGIRMWIAGNFTNSIMRIRLLTRLSNASVRISRVLEKKNFRFPETDDYWHEPAIIVGHHRQRNRPPQPTQLFAADEIVLPLICIIQGAREQCRILLVSWNRACRRKRTKGWRERVELRPTEEFMDRRRKRGSKCKCTRFAVKFHFFSSSFFFLFFLLLFVSVSGFLFVKAEEFRRGKGGWL